MYNDILAKIEALSSGFSKGQKLIASYILNHFDRAAYMRASKLGEEAGVSESTVVRFANELGLSGYPQLQGEIRESVRKRLTSVQRIALANDRLRGEDIPAAVLSADMENIRYTMENLDREAFDRATSAILEAKNIYIIGMRSSACLAEFMNHYLSLVFDNVRLVRSTSGSEIFDRLIGLTPESITDDIMRLFGTERMQKMMETLKIDDDTPIDAKVLSGAIENAQKKVESKNFQARKNTLEYDDVMNVQREIIYKQRRQVLDGENMGSHIRNMLHRWIEESVRGHQGEHKHLTAESWQLATEPFRGLFFPPEQFQYTDEELAAKSTDALITELSDTALAVYNAKEASLGEELMRELERVMMLRVVDEYWMDHIDAMEELKKGIQLRAYAQTNPVDAYKKEGFEMFEAMVQAIQEETIRRIVVARVQTNEVRRERVAKVTGESGGSEEPQKKAPVRKTIKIGPNDPCPCGSGKKYKKCCYLKDKAAQ